jgi:hypothetical protein
VVVDPDTVPDCDDSEGDDTDGKEDVGALREPDPMALSLLPTTPTLLLV